MTLHQQIQSEIARIDRDLQKPQLAYQHEKLRIKKQGLEQYLNPGNGQRSTGWSGLVVSSEADEPVHLAD